MCKLTLKYKKSLYGFIHCHIRSPILKPGRPHVFSTDFTFDKVLNAIMVCSKSKSYNISSLNKSWSLSSNSFLHASKNNFVFFKHARRLCVRRWIRLESIEPGTKNLTKLHRITPSRRPWARSLIDRDDDCRRVRSWSFRTPHSFNHLAHSCHDCCVIGMEFVVATDDIDVRPLK